MKYIIGISAFYHDSAACLIANGEIIAAAQEERFTRKKNDASFPENSIKFLLNEANLKVNDITYFVFYEKPFLKFSRLLEVYLAFAPRGFIQFSKAVPLWIKQKLFQKKIIIENLNRIDGSFIKKEKLKFSDHHFSHAASAFYPSPFEKAIVLTLDGVGEWNTSSVAIGEGSDLRIVRSIKYPHSLGLLYSAFTYYCGFKVNEGEYKLMGLAPYGEPRFVDVILKNLINVANDGSFKLNLDYFDFHIGSKMINDKFCSLFAKRARRHNQKIDQFYMDIAASIQKATENIIIQICKNLKKEFKINNLCLAGGEALNCVANGKIVNEKIFDNIWIQPAAGDAGGSLGAALAVWYQHLKNKRPNKSSNSIDVDDMQGSLLGPSYTNEEIKLFLDKKSISYIYYDDKALCKEAAKLLKKQLVLGWFSGRMEFGPRALGARSIIADPRSEKMQSVLNLKVKFRESFRPFAPIVLNSKVKDWFNLDTVSPYMLLVTQINKNKKIKKINKKIKGFQKLKEVRSIIPAVTHVDFSARVQTVDGKYNKKIFNLLKEFEKITEVPVLINTSFNVNNEPIVCTYEDALRCFQKTDIDCLILENYIVKKEK